MACPSKPLRPKRAWRRRKGARSHACHLFPPSGAIEVIDQIRDFVFPARLKMRGIIAFFEPILRRRFFLTDGILTGRGLLLDLEPT